MKLFDYEIVKFPEENSLLVTCNGYIRYIYNLKQKTWHKCNDSTCITVENYTDASSEELAASLGGVLPEKSTVFLSLCSHWDFSYHDYKALLEDEIPQLMKNWNINDAVYSILSKISNEEALEFMYEKIKGLLEEAQKTGGTPEKVISQISELGLSILGKDILCDEIEIHDNLDDSSRFYIMPSRIIAPATENRDEISSDLRSCGISIEEDDLYDNLSCFLDKYFDAELEANRDRWCENNKGFFDWYGVNFYTFNSMKAMITDIRNTAEALYCGETNEFTDKVRIRDGKIERVADFYNRFIYRIEYLMKIGGENGFNLICFEGP